MIERKITLLLLLSLLLSACNVFKKSDGNDIETIELDEMTVDIPSDKVELQERPLYQASRTRKHDLLHTQLDVRFDWSNRHLNGKALLQLKPYFYATNELILDAKGFDVHRVALVENADTTELEFRYEDEEKLWIEMQKDYTRNDTFFVYIDYTAKPDEREIKGSSAISADKGLYFIDPDSTEQNKPTQIWTQGETEASSCWFPTIDSPNERTSQEIYITVDKKYKTLSNGVMMSSTDNGDGTRTDYWKQELDHTPYLFMMAIGDFAVVKDTWRDLDVHYYVEPEFEDYARDIFMHTPEMMEFFSDILGVDYPWDKYHQVIVRDYVSGAMENTSASIFGEFVQKTGRELIDETNEGIVAHELFHQWFGNIVTCESWSNLPLNESFATYGEYLWFEYKHGRAKADHVGYESGTGYFNEAMRKQVDLIRFDYEDKEDMFDRHSYNKGGRVLHMLRKYVGDDAFFASLKKYLEDNWFTPVEIHELRLAFEEVTGEDLNWFFNQWFLSSGHPQLEINYESAESGDVTIGIRQLQNTDETPIFKLPVDIDFYFANGHVQRERVVIDKTIQDFAFSFDSKPDFINFDGEKMLLCEKRDNKSLEQFVKQYDLAPLYLDKLEALEACAREDEQGEGCTRIFLDAIGSPMDDLRVFAIEKAASLIVGEVHYIDRDKLYDRLVVATQDSVSQVRSAALDALAENYDRPELEKYYEKALQDSSYMVLAAGFEGLSALNPERAMELTEELEEIDNIDVRAALLSFYAENPDPQYHDFFINSIETASSFARYQFMKDYVMYLTYMADSDEMMRGLPIFKNTVTNSSTWWLKLGGYEGLFVMDMMLGYKVEALEEAIAEMQEDEESDKGNVAVLEQRLKDVKEKKQTYKEAFDELKAAEKDKNVMRYLETEFVRGE